MVKAMGSHPRKPRSSLTETDGIHCWHWQNYPHTAVENVPPGLELSAIERQVCLLIGRVLGRPQNTVLFRASFDDRT